MAETGYNWGAWAACGVNDVVLTTSGTILEVSDEIDLDIKAACQISVSAAYSDHTKATGGLEIGILSDYYTASWQTQDDIGAGFEMLFVQNGVRKVVFSVAPQHYGKIKINLDWNNTTASSNVTITVQYRTATIPVAS